jgi:predicted PurR-regulated permease PerM
MPAARSSESADLREFTRRTIVVIALVVLALFLWKIAPVLMLMFAGIVFASAIRAGAMPIARRTGMNETLAVALVALLFAAFIIGGAYLFGFQIAKQAQDLWDAVKDAAGKVTRLVKDTPVGDTLVGSFDGMANGQAVGKVAKGTVTVFGAVADMALVVFLSVYLASDPRTYRRGLLSLLPRSTREPVGEALDASGEALRKWLAGQLGAMLTVGVFTALGLWMAGVPLAIPLGILSGILDFVPVVGPLMAAIPGLLIAFAHDPHLALLAAAVYTTVQFVEGHLILPIAQRWAVSLPPALTLLGIVGFATVLGPMGLLFAMPLLVVTITMVDKLYVERIA